MHGLGPFGYLANHKKGLIAKKKQAFRPPNVIFLEVGIFNEILLIFFSRLHKSQRGF